MTKTIIKELIISLLLCLAIILLLGILLYKYVPISKTVPTPVAYVTSDSVKEELVKNESIDESQIITTYEIDSQDLNNYKRIQDYKPGKANPFSSYHVSEEGSTEGTSQVENNQTATGNNNNNKVNEEEQNSSGGHFFQNKGTK